MGRSAAKMNSLLFSVLLALPQWSYSQLGVKQTMKLHAINSVTARAAPTAKDLTDFHSLRSDPRVAMVEFASGRCGTCQQFQPEWEWVVRELRGLVLTRSFDVDTPNGMDQAQLSGVLS